MKKNKIVSLAVAGTLTVTALLAGTYAWQSISQQAVNENQAKLNPGARLHDDYNGTEGIKRVYVENYNDATKDGDVPILVRVRLDEYMEIGTAAGKKDTTNTDKDISTTIPTGASIDNVDTWETYIPPVDVATGNFTEDLTNHFRQYVSLTFGATETTGDVYYMPTFNMDHDSLEVDVNGTYAGTDGLYDTDEAPFSDYKKWGEGDTHTAYEIYDGDVDADPDNNGSYQSDEQKIHTAALIDKEKSVVISMTQWLTDKKLGDFWIYDADGWAYWANPLYPGEVTGLLLSENTLKNTPSDDWYYAMNVVGQFVTVEDMGNTNDKDGFYGAEEEPTSNAQILLDMLGSVTQKSLQKEVASGETVTFNFGVGSTEGTDTGENATVAIITEELADSAGNITISDETVVAIEEITNDGKVTLRGHEPGTATIIYTSANNEVFVARVTVDYATYILEASECKVDAESKVVTWTANDEGAYTEVIIEGTYIDKEAYEGKGVWYQVEVGHSAFRNMSELTSVIMKDGVTAIEGYAFYSCKNLNSVDIPESVISIGNTAFNRCSSLSSIEIPASVTSIGDYVFQDCTELKEIEIPASVTNIGVYTFQRCTNLSSVEISENLTSISMGTFDHCTSLSTVEIPENVTSIGDYAFYYCTNLESVKFSEGLRSIGNFAFYTNEKMTSIELPASLSSIGNCALSDMTKLETIKVAEGNEYFVVGDDGALYNVAENRIFAYPIASLATTFKVPKSVLTLPASIFRNAKNLQSVEILGKVTILPKNIFNACGALTNITLPASVTSIEDDAFAKCNMLEKINFGGTVAEWEALIATTTDTDNLAILHKTSLIVSCTDDPAYYYGKTTQTEATE